MISEDFKKAYQYFAGRCSKKELSEREVMVGLQKFQLKLSEKHKLINKLKKEKYIDHDRYAKAFTHDRFNFYKWGKLKIKQYLLIKGIEESLIDDALNLIDEDTYQALIKDLALKKKAQISIDDSFQAKQKICNALNTKGFEGELVFDTVESIFT
ncbi:MAG: hypothetical protein CL838_03945 [Crocinitomicaceae bacterium]|nr:hypothetical protein [Crocinitomicaceae bacterium]